MRILKLFAFLLFIGIAHAKSIADGEDHVTRIKRATGDMFDNAHIMHPNDFNRITGDPSLTAVRTQNYLAGTNRRDVHLRRNNWVNAPGNQNRDPSRTRNGVNGFLWENPNPIYRKPINTFISGTPGDVYNSFLPYSQQVQPNGRPANNVFESNYPFNAMTVRQGNGRINRISTFNSPFGAGLDNRRRPVHYQAGYTGGSRPNGRAPRENTIFQSEAELRRRAA